jgi:hypothetical protein
MAVEKFADLHRPQPNRIAAVHDAAAKAIHQACVAREAEIANMDNTISRLTKAFRGNRKFTAAEVARILSALNQFGAAVHTGRDNSLRHMNTALRCDLPTAKLIAQAEDFAALGAKIAILHQVAAASMQAEEGGDDLLQVDKAGYTVDGGAGDVMDDLPQAGGPAPMAPAPAPAPVAPPAPVQAGDMDTMLGPEGDSGSEAGMMMGDAAPPPAAPAAPAQDGFGHLPPAPVSASRRRAAGDGARYERYDVNSSESEKLPVGTPEDGGKSRTSGHEDPWKPPFVRSDIPLPDQTMAESEKLPVGVPKEFGKGGKPGDTYSRTDPGTKAPSTTLARRRQADLPEFLQDKHQDEEGCHGSLETDAGIESEANGSHGNPISNDVTKQEPAWPTASKKKATPTDSNGEPGDTYSREDPGTVEKNVKAVREARKAYEAALKAAGFDSPLPMEAPKQEPLPEVRSQVPDQDVLSDKSAFGADAGMEMGAFENTPEDFGEPPMQEEQGAFAAEEPEFGGHDELEIQQPGGDIDQAIQADILGDDFGGHEQAPGEESAPPAFPTASKGKLTAKAARRATASSHTAAANDSNDMLTSMIYEEFN